MAEYLLFLYCYKFCYNKAFSNFVSVASLLFDFLSFPHNFLQITHMEMIKGIKGHGYHDELVVPIIENTAHEAELVESLTEAVFSLICFSWS